MTPESTANANREALWTAGHLYDLAGSAREIGEIIAARQRLPVARRGASFTLAFKLAELSRLIAEYRDQDLARPETWLPGADGEVLRALLRLGQTLNRIMPDPLPLSWETYLPQVSEESLDAYGAAMTHFGDLTRQRFPVLLVNPWKREADLAKKAAEEAAKKAANQIASAPIPKASPDQPEVAPQETRYRKACEFIVKNRDRAWTVADLATALGCSRATLYRDDNIRRVIKAARPQKRGTAQVYKKGRRAEADDRYVASDDRDADD